MNKLDKQYTDLLQDILDNGTTKMDRTGTGTISVFGRQIRHKMSEGFPLLTTKKMPFKTIVTELLWFLRGDTNIKYLVDNDCHIWNGDAYQAYLKKYEKDKLHGVIYENDETQNRPFSKEEFINWVKNNDKFSELYGELGPVYGKQWRNWGVSQKVEEKMSDGRYRFVDKVINPIDQIANLINDLKTNPDSRRLMVNAWNVGELESMALPPCHYGFQVYTKELSLDERLDLMRKRTKDGTVDYDNRHHGFLDFHNIPKRAISLMWSQRSCDTFLGIPFNIASYGLLLEIIAKAVNMVPDELIGNLGDVHLYSNHIEQAKEQIGREFTWEEKIQWVMSNTDVELENLYITEAAVALSKRTREPFPLPKLNINTEFWPTESGSCGEGPIDALAVFNGFFNDDFCKCLLEDDIQLSNYQSHPTIKAPLSN